MSTAGSERLCFPFGSRLRQRLPVLHYKNMVLKKNDSEKENVDMIPLFLFYKSARPLRQLQQIVL